MIEDLDILGALAIVALLIVALSLYRAHRGQSEFNLADLITTKGKIDNAKFCQIGAFFVSSFVVYYMTIKGGLTEWAFWGYMGAWVGARAFSLMAAVKGHKNEPQPPAAV